MAVAVVPPTRLRAMQTPSSTPWLDELSELLRIPSISADPAHRDDVLAGGHLPLLRGTEIDFDVEGRPIVLVDDVLFTGRTVRAGLDALLDLGRPGCVRLAVLVDRGLRELPIAADFTGRALETTRLEHVSVQFVEAGHEQDAVIVAVKADRRSP